MTDEVWVSIPGWENKYEVSSWGNVRSLPREVVRSNGRTLRLSGRVLKPLAQTTGHLHVTLPDGHRLVHRLVASAFIPNPQGKPQVLHNDGNPANNHWENLRWGTQSENMLDRRRHGTDPEVNKTHCAKGHPYSEENTRHYRGGRICKACSKAHSERWASLNRGAPLSPDSPLHGTITGYNFYQCACDRCKDAARKYRQDLARRRAENPLPESDPRHGTRSGYDWGCRCSSCREANSARQRRNYLERKARSTSKNQPRQK